jgi:CRISPR-associated protein Cas5h
MKKLISFIIKAEKGFLKKPDINDGIYLTYNMLHKPAILGILGAIIGLEGYQKNEVLPEYYKKLKDIPVGAEPIGHEKGNFPKTVITYNNTTGFASHETGGNLMVTEQTLISPSYQIYLLLDLEILDQKRLYENIKNQHAEYLPYLGKNDYSLWWDKEEVVEYGWDKIERFDSHFKISSVFIKRAAVKEMQKTNDSFDLLDFSLLSEEPEFVSFERLPINFNEQLFQYNYENFGYTNSKFKSNVQIENIYKLDNGSFVQLN